MSLNTKTLTELSSLLEKKEITSQELTESYIAEIESRDGEINAFVTCTFDMARQMAQDADGRRKNNTPLSPLDGIPLTLKDVVCTDGIRTTASSQILKDFIPPYNATVWQRLKDAGCVLLGKVNTDEFTMGSSTETSAFGVTKNPQNITHVSGGSSGGSAAAIAANFCAGSIGTDTGGSIRQPAHFCGITGLKVSYGRVSRWGCIPMASSLDTVGPMAQTAEDCALMLEIIAGKDTKDATTPDKKVPRYSQEIHKKLSGLKIGIPKEYLEKLTDTDTQRVFEDTKKTLQSQGVELIDLSLPHTQYAIPTYYIIAPAEISANMSRFDGIRFGNGESGNDLQEMYEETRGQHLGDEVKRRILTGVHVLSAGYSDQFYLKAQQVRTRIIQEFEQAFQSVDALLTPVSPTPAFEIGGKKDPLNMYMEDIFLTPSSLAGCCGISVPMGTSTHNLPIGMHFIGPAFQEEILLRIGHQLQSRW